MSDHKHDETCKCKATVAAQSLDELDFDRGIWSAGEYLHIIITTSFRVNSLRFPSTALYNDLNRLKHFIEMGQQNATDKMGFTSLHYAARNGHYEACELLLDAGANINAITASGGVTPLMRAAMTSKQFS